MGRYPEIEKLLKEDKYELAIQRINEEISRIDNNQDIAELLLKKCEILNDIGNYSQTLEIIENNKQIIQTSPHLIRIKFSLAEIFSKYRLDKNEEAFKQIQQLEKQNYFKQINSIYIKSMILVLKSYILLSLGHFEKAYLAAKENLFLCMEEKEQSLLARAYYALGRVQVNSGEIEEAINNFHKSLEIREKIGSTKFAIAHSLFNLGYAYKLKGEFKKAKFYLEKSLKFRKEVGNKQDIAWTLLNLGDIEFALGNNKLAETYFEESLYVNQSSNYIFGVIFSLMRLSSIYEKIQNYPLALDALNKALDYSKQVEQVESEFYVLFDLIEFIARNKNKLVSSFSGDKQKYKDQLEKELENYLQRLRGLARIENNILFSQISELAYALVLKESKELKNIRKAFEILQQISKEKVSNYYFTQIAMKNYSEMLAEELRKHLGDTRYINRLNELTGSLAETKLVKSYSFLASSYLSKTQLALNEVNIEKAGKLLRNAERLSTFLTLYKKGSTAFKLLYLIYGKEKGLVELSKELKVTKGALTNHIKLLLKLELIEISREEQVRSDTMLKKYYCLSERGKELLGSFQLDIRACLEQKEEFDSITMHLITKMVTDFVLDIVAFQDFLDEQVFTMFTEETNTKESLNENELKNLMSHFHNNDKISITQHFLTEKQFKEYEKLKEKYNKELITILETKKNEGEEKNHYVLELSAPTLKLIRFHSALDKMKKEKRKN